MVPQHSAYLRCNLQHIYLVSQRSRKASTLRRELANCVASRESRFCQKHSLNSRSSRALVRGRKKNEIDVVQEEGRSFSTGFGRCSGRCCIFQDHPHNALASPLHAFVVRPTTKTHLRQRRIRPASGESFIDSPKICQHSVSHHVVSVSSFILRKNHAT